MNNAELRSKLSSLHDTLAHSPAVDPESRQLLRTLLEDIEQLLEKSSSGAAAAPAHVNRLEQYASRFDADHPSLSGMLRQLVDLLGRAGI